MNKFTVAALLLGAAPLYCNAPAAADPVIDSGGFQWFSLTESKQQVAQLLGNPVLAASFNSELEAWQFQLGDVADEDFSHYLLFSRSDGKLVSVARNYDPARNIDQFFPVSETAVYSVPVAGRGAFYFRVRRLPGGRLLLAPGTSKQGETAGQIVLIREFAVRILYPSLYEQLSLRLIL